MRLATYTTPSAATRATNARAKIHELVFEAGPSDDPSAVGVGDAVSEPEPKPLGDAPLDDVAKGVGEPASEGSVVAVEVGAGAVGAADGDAAPGGGGVVPGGLSGIRTRRPVTAQWAG